MKKFFIFLFFLIVIDFILSQLFFLDILYKKKIITHKNDIENRLPNKDYVYGFKENAKFESRYHNGFNNLDYLIYTNNLGFRDSSIRELQKSKTYSIVIGDSFVEGTGLKYEDTLVAILNNKLKNRKFEFLNAGVASYSTYIYKKKIETVLNDNKWLKINSVILFYDKSDIYDDLKFFGKPETFSTEKKIYKNPKKEKLIKDIKNFKIGSILTEQTMIGIFYREILGGSLEKLVQNIKFRKKLSKDLNLNFFSINKIQTNTLYSTHQYKWLQKYLLPPLWEEKSLQSIEFAFENFKDLKVFLEKRNIKLYVVIYPWPLELINKEIKKNYLDFVEKKFKQNEINNIIIYNEFVGENVAEIIYRYYLPKDIHFNKKGNSILSDRIYERLSKDNLLKEKSN